MTQTCDHARVHTHTLMHTHTHTLKGAHTLTHIHTHKHERTHTHTHTSTHQAPPRLTCKHAHAHSQTHTKSNQNRALAQLSTSSSFKTATLSASRRHRMVSDITCPYSPCFVWPAASYLAFSTNTGLFRYLLPANSFPQVGYLTADDVGRENAMYVARCLESGKGTTSSKPVDGFRLSEAQLDSTGEKEQFGLATVSFAVRRAIPMRGC